MLELTGKRDISLIMRQLLTPVLAVAFLLLDGRVSGVENPAVAPLIWRLDNLAQLNGHAVEVLGHPQVVKEAARSAIHFDGVGDGIFVPTNPLANLAGFTVEVLVKPEAGGLEEQRFLHVEDKDENRGLLELRLGPEGWAVDSFLYSHKNNSRSPLLDRSKVHPADRWAWVTLVYANGQMAHYVNGIKELEGAINFSPMSSGKTSLGVRQNKVSWFKGCIAEVRIHPRALVADEMQRVTVDKVP